MDPETVYFRSSVCPVPHSPGTPPPLPRASQGSSTAGTHIASGVKRLKDYWLKRFKRLKDYWVKRFTYYCGAGGITPLPALGPPRPATTRALHTPSRSPRSRAPLLTRVPYHSPALLKPMLLPLPLITVLVYLSTQVIN